MAKTLVAFFSASGVTGKVAKRLAQATDADVYEIVPEQPYTAADLDWTNGKSRSTVEMNDRSSRPAIKGAAPDLAAYDRVFVGFPVWWYREPSIIDTFMESADFSGKAVVPFATSGGSPIGEAGKNMAELAFGAKVFEGRRFNSNVSTEELGEWARQF